MEKRGLSLAKIQEVPKESLILLSGLPGAGKSTFCHQVVINSLAMEKPIIYVTTEHSPSEVINLLREKGMGELLPGVLSFIDAFGETVGVKTPERPDTVGANCEDLNSISMAITKLQERVGQGDVFLAFDSLTSPYLFNKEEVFRFIRLCLAKFASKGNSVLALMDEGCGKEEDLGAMMSVADGIIRMEITENKRSLNVIKHPNMKPVKIDVPTEPVHPGVSQPDITFRSPMVKKWIRAMLFKGEAGVRRECGDYVNLFWPNLAHWSGMLWDPKRFPITTYELNKEDPRSMMRENRAVWPWYARLSMNIFFPKNYSRVKDMKKASKLGVPYINTAHWEHSGIVEYLGDISKTDEHYFRIYENSDCWGLENVGAAVASHLPPLFAGFCKGFEKDEREWNAIETKCIGLGDPYCEFKLVPGEISDLKRSLEKTSSVIERIHERLIERLIGFLLHDKPLVDRPKLGSDLQLHAVWHAMGVHPPGGERYKMALRMGGAKSGKAIGESLIEAGLGEDEVIRRVIDFMEYCKVGKITRDETIRIKESCESSWAKLFVFPAEPVEPSCYFTTGFLNGLFSAVKNQHVREIKCIAAGDLYCEWEIV
jgi:KaiC/GvpD/RAD55 family RecA-like ATPase/predicted hydrocarbon binding protein